MGNLQGSEQLKARLKALRLVFKPMGKKWADEAVVIGRPMLPIRSASMKADHAPGRLHDSIRRKSATQRKAVVAAHYSAYFVDAGVKPHSMNKRGKGQDRTVFAKKHPGYKARPFRARMATEALRREPLLETLIAQWNSAA